MRIEDEGRTADTTSSDDDSADDATFRVQQRPHGKGPAAHSDDEHEGNDGEEEEEEEPLPHHNPAPEADLARKTSKPYRPPNKPAINYNARGKFEDIRRERRKDFRAKQRDAFDWRFHTRFQEDYYETVITSKKHPVTDDQWIDWNYMTKKKDPIFDQVIAACDRQHIQKIMGFRHDWNKEIIAQFYATVYFDDTDANPRKWQMVWMTEGDTHSISYLDFAIVLGMDNHDLNRPKIHLE